VRPNPQDQDTNSPKGYDPDTEWSDLATGRWLARLHAAPPAPARSGRLDAAVSWLWRFLVDGFAATAFAFHPCFEHPSDLFDSLYPRRREPAEQPIKTPAEQSPWHFEDLAREAMTVRLSDDATFAESEPGTREQGAGKSETM
jgi:hypothetical protein